MHFADSHLHLSEYADYGPLLRIADLSKIMLFSTSVDRSTSLVTLGIARGKPDPVKAFVGVHPSEAWREPNLDWFEEALRTATGAGELGLDPNYSEVSPRSPQMGTFNRQLAAVERIGKPIQIHSRDAEAQCLEVLSTYQLGSVLMHWFENESLVREVVDRGYFLSFGPALLFSKKLQRMATMAAPEQVLAESDGPVAFKPLGGVSGPSLIPSVLFKLAQLWKKTFTEAQELVLENSSNYLGAGGKT